MEKEPGHLEVIKHKKEESLAIRAAKHFFDLATVRRGKEPYEWLVGEREFIRNKISDLFQGQKVNKNKPLKIIIDYDPDYEYASAGVLGEYETGVVGNYSSMEQELAFRTLESDMFNLMDPTQPVDITFRASQQSTVKSSGALDYVSMRIVERGRFKSFEPGKIERGKQMEAKLKFELFYILIEIDGNTVIEYDKLNSVFTVNGKDLLEKVRSQC